MVKRPPTPEISHFEDEFKTGEKISIPFNHALAQNDWPYRSLELEAISQWAKKNGIALRSESHIAISKSPEGKILSAHVLTYTYKACPQKTLPLRHEQKPTQLLDHPMATRLDA